MGFWIFILVIVVLGLASHAINQFVVLKKEHNDLLREIIQKLDNKQGL